MAAEFLKYGGDDLHEAIAVLLNAIFIKHESIPDLKAGLLLALINPSPKKTIVEHTRPIIHTPISPAVVLENSFGLFSIFVQSRKDMASALTFYSSTLRRPLIALTALCF